MSSYFLGNYKVFIIMINLLQEKIKPNGKTSIDNWNGLLDIFRFIKRQFLMRPKNGSLWKENIAKMQYKNIILVNFYLINDHIIHKALNVHNFYFL